MKWLRGILDAWTYLKEASVSRPQNCNTVVSGCKRRKQARSRDPTSNGTEVRRAAGYSCLQRAGKRNSEDNRPSDLNHIRTRGSEYAGNEKTVLARKASLDKTND